MKKPNLQETKSARVMQVIETVSLAGDGTDANPVYEVHQYWTLDGKLLAKPGSLEMEQNLSDLSTGQLLKELVKRNDVKVIEHHLSNNCINVSLQIGHFGCYEIQDFTKSDDCSR
ncbi:hypothetical protein [Faecalibacterium sp. AM43-5AT]|jgi:hypothetical protein|uniref:hypothetical protein n=1 Tax=Faecalibacterium sp. AM43-5AT TaxID=2302957 RepID=UPI001A9B2776|nr:hypothetical protein [Faecalibacterium sp. AM43-5AT]